MPVSMTTSSGEDLPGGIEALFVGISLRVASSGARTPRLPCCRSRARRSTRSGGSTR